MKKYCILLKMNQDIFYNILLHSDIHTVNSLLRMNKHLCVNAHFWMNKLEMDFLYIIPITQEWVKDYIHVYECNKKASQFIGQLSENDGLNDGLYFYDHTFKCDNIIPDKYLPLNIYQNIFKLSPLYVQISLWFNIQYIKSKDLIGMLSMFVTNLYYTKENVIICSSFN